jgi:hypothetical protein
MEKVWRTEKNRGADLYSVSYLGTKKRRTIQRYCSDIFRAVTTCCTYSPDLHLVTIMMMRPISAWFSRSASVAVRRPSAMDYELSIYAVPSVQATVARTEYGCRGALSMLPASYDSYDVLFGLEKTGPSEV